MNDAAARAVRGVRAFLLDLDGTVYLGGTPIPGSADFVAYLQQSGTPFLFLTNNPSADAAHYSEKLGRVLGLRVGPEHILTAGEATARHLAEQTPWRRLFVLGTPSFERELTNAGLTLDDRAPEAVVIAFDKTLTYAKLERACLLLAGGLPYIATNPDRVCPMEYGYIPDCGAIAALIEAATGRVPRYVGKPEPEFARVALRRLGVAAAETAMVGDRLYTDMAMARNAGLFALLVLSGETSRQDIDASEWKPDLVLESVAELHRLLA